MSIATSTLLFCAVLETGAARPVPLLQVSGAELTAEERRALEGVLAPFDQSNAPGLAVAVWRDGVVVFEAGRGLADLERHVPITPQSVFDIASTSKQFTAASILLLAEEGLLDISQPVHELLPELPRFGQALCVRDLLAHQSGLPDYLLLMGLCGYDDSSFYDLDDVMKRLTKVERTTFEAGTRYVYSNSNYLVLASIVHRISGKTLREFAHERIFVPLGMQHSHFHDARNELVPNRALGYAANEGGYELSVTPLELVGDGALLTTTHDLFLWSQHFRSRALGGASLWDDASAALQVAPFPFADGRPGRYAFGLDISRCAVGTLITHSGAFAGYRSELLHCPEAGFGAVVLCNSDEHDPTAIARALVRAVGCEPRAVKGVEEPALEVASTADGRALPAWWRDLRGLWVDPAGVPLQITRDKEQLVVSGPFADWRVGAPSANAAQLSSDDGTLVVALDKDGALVVERGATSLEFGRPAPFADDAASWDGLLGTWRVPALDCAWELVRRAGRAPGFDVVFPGGETLRGVALGDGLMRGPLSSLMWRSAAGWTLWSDQFGLLRLER